MIQNTYFSFLEPNSPSPQYSAQKYAEIQAAYPALYKAWKSLLGNNAASDISPEWLGGVIGLMRFIEDTSPATHAHKKDNTSKLYLKRVDTSKPFSASNVYWVVPAKYVVPRSESDASDASDASVPVEIVASILVKLTELSVSEREEKLTELFNLSMSHIALSVTQRVEMEVLGKLLEVR